MMRSGGALESAPPFLSGRWAMRILIIEDDIQAAAAMAKGLEEAGHESQLAEDGLAGLNAARDGKFDVLVVDRMMPKLNGVQVVETLRREGDQTPVLFLSALGEVGDRVEGLKAGGDDYLVKPYAFAELIARVEALSRRRETGSVSTVLKVGDLEMDLIGRSVHRAGTEIDLQPREFQLLEFLMRHANQSVTRTMLLEKVWEYHFDPQTNVIDVHISRLRSKIDKGFPRAMLQTVRGAGYRLEA
jgi:two-component system OmpR family response regulator